VNDDDDDNDKILDRSKTAIATSSLTQDINGLPRFAV
jgi:hypothetical protein